MMGAAQPASGSDSSSSDDLVAFRSIRKRYNNVLAVDRLDLDVRRGEMLTFLGPSGSGKTSILMMLAGFEPIDEGEILLAGRPLSPIPPHRRDIGMVFQSYALFPNLTVFENLAFPLKVRNVGREDIRRRVEDALAMIRMSTFGDRRPNQLSGGQQQRVALARALIFNPKLVLLDEPLGALDRQLREQLQTELRELHKRLGVTMIYVTHDQIEALTMSDRIAVFNQGKLQQLGEPTALYDFPENQFVAEFLGENNRFEAQVENVADGSCTAAFGEGLSVRAAVSGTPTVADRVAVYVRPERVSLASGQLDNEFDAQIDAVTFLGDQLRVRLRLPGGVPISMKVAHGSGSVLPVMGERMRIGWRAGNCVAFALA